MGARPWLFSSALALPLFSWEFSTTCPVHLPAFARPGADVRQEVDEHGVGHGGRGWVEVGCLGVRKVLSVVREGLVCLRRDPGHASRSCSVWVPDAENRRP